MPKGAARSRRRFPPFTNDLRTPIFQPAPPGTWENSMKLFRPLFGLLAVAALFAMLAGDADARPRGSFGSRGTRTYTAPAPTATAPNAASPINRSMTQPGAATSTAARPPLAQPAGGMFGRGL